ncbi:MAG: hypothetical protein H0V95_02775 [Actinobacteria bacterium]|nr:hypothetical protein [Actinomycetota bacterium]
MAARRKSTMTTAHKRALAEGRELGRAVRKYLDALHQNRPRRGRKRTTESIKRRLDTIAKQLTDASPLQRLQLVQERMDLKAELEQLGAKVDLSALERDFAQVARDYSERKGISYAAWRELGVPADVLKRAGIGRSN